MVKEIRDDCGRDGHIGLICIVYNLERYNISNSAHFLYQQDPFTYSKYQLSAQLPVDVYF